MQLDELNNKINEFVYELKDADGTLTWDTVADITNDRFDEYDISLTGNACRKRFKRFTENMATTTQVVAKNAPEYDTVVIDRASDITSQLVKMFFG